jgi:hypothetical protein
MNKGGSLGVNPWKMISRYASYAEIRKVSEMPQGVVPHHKIDETKVMYFILKRANFASSDG